MHNQILTGLVDLDATYIHTEYTITRLNHTVHGKKSRNTFILDNQSTNKS